MGLGECSCVGFGETYEVTVFCTDGGQTDKYVRLLLDGEEGCCPPVEVLWTSFSRGIVGMGDITPKMLLCGCHNTDYIYRFITLN